MKRILVASHSMEIGGIEKASIEFLKFLNAQNFEVTLLLQEKKGPLLKEVPANVKVEEYKLSNNKNILFRKIYNRIKLWKYIITHYYTYDYAICYATYDISASIFCRYVSKNSILWVHSNYVQAYQSEPKIRNFFDTRKVEKFSKVVFVSTEAKEDLLKYYPSLSKKSFAINNFLDFHVIKEKAKEKIEIQRTNPTLLFVGRLEETSKGLTRLLEVMKDFQEEKKSFELWIVGDGPSKDFYIDYVKNENLKNVKFFGMQKNPYPYMQKADLFVLPSNYEGFPVVCLEALSFGLKVVTTIDVSTDDFQLSDYVFLCERTISDIKEKIEYAFSHEPKKKFQENELNHSNEKKLLELLGDTYEI